MKYKKGFCLWFTGLSGAGKSTVSQAVHAALHARYGDEIEVLDGDVVRTHLTRGLGFAKEDRDMNVRRIGWVCQLLVKHDVPVMTAAISPYRQVRDEVREMVEEVGANAFIEIYVNASVEVCATRDVKGLYAKAMKGEIPNFTGVSDPYEAPESPELTLDTEHETVEESVAKVLALLESRALLPVGGGSA